jgi:hypothetical protein
MGLVESSPCPTVGNAIKRLELKVSYVIYPPPNDNPSPAYTAARNRDKMGLAP